VENRRGGRLAPKTVNSSVRTREYLTTAEVERLMATARKSSRYGHRDATMILIGYRHGLRASELCDLQWSQVELANGRLHVRRTKNGSPSVHPMQGDEIRALRRLQREQGLSSHVFMTERDGPMRPRPSTRYSVGSGATLRGGRRPWLPSRKTGGESRNPHTGDTFLPWEPPNAA
jgi:integrase